MRNTLLSGFWRYMLNIPPGLWERQVAKARGRIEAELADLSALDRLVHHHVVEALPKAGKPLSPSWIGERMGLPTALVSGALERLEKRMTFLYRCVLKGERLLPVGRAGESIPAQGPPHTRGLLQYAPGGLLDPDRPERGIRVRRQRKVIFRNTPSVRSALSVSAG